MVIFQRIFVDKDKRNERYIFLETIILLAKCRIDLQRLNNI